MVVGPKEGLTKKICLQTKMITYFVLNMHVCVCGSYMHVQVQVCMCQCVCVSQRITLDIIYLILSVAFQYSLPFGLGFAK